MAFTEPSHSGAKNREINTTNSSLSDQENHQYRHVMCFGTFDIFHLGHEFYLSEAEKLADTMTIVIARDHRVFSGKWQDPVHDETSRQQIVTDHFPTASVILGHESDIFAPIREKSPDLLAFWYDQRVPEDILREKFPQIEIVRIWGYETEKYKSSILRKNIQSK